MAYDGIRPVALATDHLSTVLSDDRDLCLAARGTWLGFCLERRVRYESTTSVVAVAEGAASDGQAEAEGMNGKIVPISKRQLNGAASSTAPQRAGAVVAKIRSDLNRLRSPEEDRLSDARAQYLCLPSAHRPGSEADKELEEVQGAKARGSSSRRRRSRRRRKHWL